MNNKIKNSDSEFFQIYNINPDNLTNSQLTKLSALFDFVQNIYQKFETNIPYTIEELQFIYGLYNIWQKLDFDSNYYTLYHLQKLKQDKKILQIKNTRQNIKKDLCQIFNCSKQDIALSYEELKKYQSKIYYGDLYLKGLDLNLDEETNNDYIFTVQNLNIIIGNFTLNSSTAIGLENLKYIYGNADFSNLYTSSYLENLTYIGGNLNLNNIQNPTFLTNLKIIDGTFSAPNLQTSLGLENLKYIRGSAKLPSLTNAKGLINLKQIGKNALFNNLKNSKGLQNLESVYRLANFQKLNDVKYLNNLIYVGTFCYKNKQNAIQLKYKIIDNQNKRKTTKLYKIKEIICAIFNINTPNQVDYSKTLHI